MGVLDDVSVVELSIAIAAPSCGRALAFHGAFVAKLESRTNPDVARLFGSAWARDVDPVGIPGTGIAQGVYLTKAQDPRHPGMIIRIGGADVFGQT